jgi:hypothetical protein
MRPRAERKLKFRGAGCVGSGTVGAVGAARPSAAAKSSIPRGGRSAGAGCAGTGAAPIEDSGHCAFPSGADQVSSGVSSQLGNGTGAISGNGWACGKGAGTIAGARSGTGKGLPASGASPPISIPDRSRIVGSAGTGSKPGSGGIDGGTGKISMVGTEGIAGKPGKRISSCISCGSRAGVAMIFGIGNDGGISPGSCEGNSRGSRAASGFVNPIGPRIGARAANSFDLSFRKLMP